MTSVAKIGSLVVTISVVGSGNLVCKLTRATVTLYALTGLPED
jgi:hypothetical protein